MDIKYIGRDVHQETISIAVLNGDGKLVMESIIETKAITILQLIRGLGGDLPVRFEQGTWAAWWYDLLKPQVTELVVCDPGKNALMKEGNKSDKIDARNQGVPLWQPLSQAGIPSTILRCPCTFPPETVLGRMLAGVGVPDLRRSQSKGTPPRCLTLPATKFPRPYKGARWWLGWKRKAHAAGRTANRRESCTIGWRGWSTCSAVAKVLSPFQGCGHVPPCTQGLRRGPHSGAALRPWAGIAI